MLIVSADVWNEFDYASLAARAAAMKDRNDTPRVHLVMVPNPAHHPGGDFVLAGGRITEGEGPRLTYGNIGLYDTALFRELPHGSKLKITPFYHQWISRGLVSGELYTVPGPMSVHPTIWPDWIPPANDCTSDEHDRERLMQRCTQ